MQPGLGHGAVARAEVAQYPEHASLRPPDGMRKVAGVEVGAVVEGKRHAAGERLQAPLDGCLRHLGERHDARAKRVQELKVGSERRVVVRAIVRTRDVHRVVGEDRHCGARHGARRA